MSLEALELAAWRFLALHRVTRASSVSHIQFIDADVCFINAPETAEYYASEYGATFGEAAIKLALVLGMPWPKQCDETLASAFVTAGAKSSASTASRPSGANGKTSPRTRAATAGSTTDATGADRRTGARGAGRGGSR